MTTTETHNKNQGATQTGDMVEVFDTTLRDGMQVEGVSATVEDKLRIAEQLDFLGVHYIEGGWPGANPKDEEFFTRAATELTLSTSTLVAFGSTRRPRGKVDDDATLRNLLAANTSAVCIVAKSWDYHVTSALQTTLEEGVAMVGDSVRFLHGNGRRVLVDLEHFFDGYKRNPEFALQVAAIRRGMQGGGEMGGGGRRWKNYTRRTLNLYNPYKPNDPNNHYNPNNPYPFITPISYNS